MTRRRQMVLAVVLVAALFAQAAGGVPLSTLVLVAGVAVLFGTASERPLPWLPLPVVLGTLALACGLLGTNRSELPTSLKQLVQLGEIGLVALYLGQFGDRRQSRAYLVRLLGGLGFALLALPLLGGMAWFDLSFAKWGGFATLAAPFLVLALGRCCPWAGFLPGLLAGLAFSHAGPLLVWCAVVVLAGYGCWGRRHWPSLLMAGVALLVSVSPGRTGIWQRLRPDYDENHLKRSIIEVDVALRSPFRLPLGAGLGQYRPAINRLRTYGAATPHPDDTRVPRDGNSQYLVTLVEAGVIGLAGLLGLLAAGAVAAWRPVAGETAAEFQERRTVAVALAGALGAGLFTLTVSRGIGIWIGLLLALALAPARLPGTSRRLFGLLACWGGVAAILLVALVVNAGDGARVWPRRANRAVAALYAETRRAEPRIVVLPDSHAGSGGGVVMVEAESAFEVMPPFLVVQADGASGGAALAIPDGRGKGIGRATLELTVPEAGRYLLFARVFWADGCANSIGFRIAGQEIRLSDDIYQRWHYLEGRTVLELPEGRTLLEVVNLEDGVMVDYLGLRAVGGTD